MGSAKALLSAYVSPGAAGVSSRHHSSFRGLSTCLGLENFKAQTCLGTMEHSCLGFKLGTNLVANRHVFCGFRSQISSGTSTTVSWSLSWHSSGPGSVVQPWPQILTGNFSQVVSPTNLPKMYRSIVGFDGRALLYRLVFGCIGFDSLIRTPFCILRGLGRCRS